MQRVQADGVYDSLPARRELAQSPGFFGPGDPATGRMSTRVPYEWCNAVQEELASVITGAGLTLDAANNAQVLAAIQQLISVKTTLATVAKAGLVIPDGTSITVDSTGKITAHAAKYDICEFYYFRNPVLKSGMQPAQGGLITNAATRYPEAWAYLQTTEGQQLCKSEAEWQAMTTATWATLADGTNIGWDGIGGAPFYVQDLAAGTLRMPDLRGMYPEAAGFDSLGVGDVHGDATRRQTGSIGVNNAQFDTPKEIFAQGELGGRLLATSGYNPSVLVSVRFDSSRVVPTAVKNQPRAWGNLACCYLGKQES